jgi:hypothetical protein
MPDYHALYPAGTWVQVAPRDVLETLARTWLYRQDFRPEQLTHAGRVAQVQDISCYFAGDAVYRCNELPGMWHELCLRPTAAPGSSPTRD